MKSASLPQPEAFFTSPIRSRPCPGRLFLCAHRTTITCDELRSPLHPAQPIVARQPVCLPRHQPAKQGILRRRKPTQTRRVISIASIAVSIEPCSATIRDVDLQGTRGKRAAQECLILSSGEIPSRAAPLDQTPEHLRRLNDIAFSGDGEPTSYPPFHRASEIAVDLLAACGLAETKIVVITNATLFHREPVKETLRFLDHHNGEIWAKLDAGTEEYYRLIERTSIPLQRVLDNILLAGRERPIVIQSLFMRVNGEAPSDSEIGEFVRRLIELRSGGCQIKLVQVYTVARNTAESFVTPLDKSHVDSIAEKVRATGLNVEAYYGPN